MIVVIGKVYLSSAYGDGRFTTDPKIRRTWPVRQRVIQGLMGSATIQDFGRWAADMTLTLTSGGNYINADFKAYLDGLAAVRGVGYGYRDYTGIEATVKILSFDPEPTFIKDGDSVLWEYSLTLQVLTLDKLDHATYSGN